MTKNYDDQDSHNDKEDENSDQEKKQYFDPMRAWKIVCGSNLKTPT